MTPITHYLPVLPVPRCVESVALCCPTLPLGNLRSPVTGVDLSPALTGNVTAIQHLHIKPKSQLERVMIFDLHTWSFPHYFKCNHRKIVYLI